MTNDGGDDNGGRWRAMPSVNPEGLDLNETDYETLNEWFPPTDRLAADGPESEPNRGSEPSRLAEPDNGPRAANAGRWVSNAGSPASNAQNRVSNAGPPPWMERPPSLLDAKDESSSPSYSVREKAKTHWKALAVAVTAVVALLAFVQSSGGGSDNLLTDPAATATSVDGAPVDSQPADGLLDFGQPNAGQPDAGQPDAGQPFDDNSAGQLAAPLTAADPAPASAGQAPYVRYQWENNTLTLSGYLPDEDLRARLVGNVFKLVGEQHVRVDLSEERGGAVPAWLWAAPEVAFELSRFASADAVLAEGRIQLKATSRAMDRGTELATFMQNRTGLPVEILSLDQVNLRGAQFRVAWQEGRVVLAGALPTEELRSAFLASAAERFGAGNVIDSSSVDPGVQFEHWMREGEWIFQAFSNFDRVAIEQNGDDFFIGLGGGPSFASGEAGEIDLGEAIFWIADHLYEDPGLVAMVRGHTDGVGSAEYNLHLSHLRADAVRDQFLDIGVTPGQVEAVGVGANEPVASDATAEGRAQNRRIEILLRRQQVVGPESVGQAPAGGQGQQVGQGLGPTG